MKETHKIILADTIRYMRLLICTILFCFNFAFSQQSPKAISFFNDKNEYHSSQSEIFIEQGAIIYADPKEEYITPNAKQDLPAKNPSAQVIIYTTEGAYIYAEENSSATKIVEIKVVKNRSIAKDSIKNQKKERGTTSLEKIYPKKNSPRSIALKVFFNSTENSSRFSHHNQEKNIGISITNISFKDKKSFFNQSECFSKEIFYFQYKQNHQYHFLFDSLLVFEHYFTRPPPIIS